jgi:tetratricopeptide (TPR) repeat protein
VAGLVVAVANSCFFLGRFAGALNLLLQHQARVERTGDPTLLGPYYFWLGHMYSYLSDHVQDIAWGDRARAEAIRAGDDATLRKANYLLARAHFWLCEFTRGLTYANDAVELPATPEDRWWLGQSYWHQALLYAVTGDLEASRAAVTRLLAIAEALADPRLHSYAEWMASVVSSFSGDGERAFREGSRSVSVAPDTVSVAVARGFLGYAHLVNGDAMQAIPQLESAVADLHRFGFRGLEALLAGILGEAYLATGQTAKARELAGYGAEAGAETFRFALGWAQRALGDVAQASGALAEAESQYTAALATFTAIDARLETARTTLAMAELAAVRKDLTTAALHLTEAVRLFRTLNVPFLEQQAAQLAATHGLTVEGIS